MKVLIAADKCTRPGKHKAEDCEACAAFHHTKPKAAKEAWEEPIFDPAGSKEYWEERIFEQ